MFYGFLADVVEGVHLSFLVVTLLGQLAIIGGWFLGWKWIRNPWFRSIHLLAIAFVAMEYVVGMECPLTDLEKYLRRLAGQTSDDWSFMDRLMNDCLFPGVDPEDLTWPYIGFAVLVIVTYILIPPRFRKPSSLAKT
jgi:hypothetical protein